MFAKPLIAKSLPKWYVAYILPKAERRAQRILEKMGIESYLPMHQEIRNWSDRKKKLIVPLFPNYLFINATDDQRHRSFEIKEIVRYVSFNGKPALVNDYVINDLKCILTGTHEVQVEENFEMGSMVRVDRGPFSGTRGYVVNCYGKTKLLIHFEALQSAVGVIISADDVSPISSLAGNCPAIISNGDIA